MAFGVYPQDILWRPAFSLALMVGVVGLSMAPRFWGWPLFVGWVVTPAAVCVLLGGARRCDPSRPTTGAVCR